MGKNNIHGIIMRPCSLTNEENEKIMHSTDVSVKEDFYKSYSHHIGAMQIVAECAKIYILNNWEKVDDWSDLNVVVEDANHNSSIEYLNYKEHEPKWGSGAGDTMKKLWAKIEEEKKKKHNPITSVKDVVLDPSDGDFSLTINGNDHLWISDETVIIIADYIEKRLNGKKD